MVCCSTRFSCVLMSAAVPLGRAPLFSPMICNYGDRINKHTFHPWPRLNDRALFSESTTVSFLTGRAKQHTHWKWLKINVGAQELCNSFLAPPVCLGSSCHDFLLAVPSSAAREAKLWCQSSWVLLCELGNRGRMLELWPRLRHWTPLPVPASPWWHPFLSHAWVKTTAWCSPCLANEGIGFL